jgi:predicted nucleotidyltransferase
MPTDEKILEFGNRWYKTAIKHAIIHQIIEDLPIKSITAPYFLATKLEAFRDRGENDFVGSREKDYLFQVF